VPGYDVAVARSLSCGRFVVLRWVITCDAFSIQLTGGVLPKLPCCRGTISGGPDPDEIVFRGSPPRFRCRKNRSAIITRHGRMQRDSRVHSQQCASAGWACSESNPPTRPFGCATVRLPSASGANEILPRSRCMTISTRRVKSISRMRRRTLDIGSMRLEIANVLDAREVMNEAGVTSQLGTGCEGHVDGRCSSWPFSKFGNDSCCAPRSEDLAN